MEYPDLPGWAQPGAKAAVYRYGEATEVTVQRATKTQIIVLNAAGHEARMEREPHDYSVHMKREFEGPRFRQRGTYSTYLVSLDELPVRRAMLKEAVTRALTRAEMAVEKLVQARRNPDRDDKRTVTERALQEIDAIENAAREARKKVLAALETYGEEKVEADADE